MNRVLRFKPRGHCFSVAFNKTRMCSDEAHHHPRNLDPHRLLRLPAGKARGQDPGCRRHGGRCAVQKVMSWLPYWRGGGRHSSHGCFSMAPESNVPKSALAIRNF